MKYKYVYDVLNMVRTPNSAKKGERYWLFPNQRFELVFAKGDKYTPHFRALTSNENREYDRDKFNSINESDLHYQAKLHIASTKYFKLSNDIIIQGTEAYTEEDKHGKWQGHKYKPDVIYYDDNGKILCFVEIYVTHKIDDDKTEYYAKQGIDVYELKFTDNDFEEPTAVRYLPRESERKRIEAFGERQEEFRIEFERLEEDIIGYRNKIRYREAEIEEELREEEEEFRKSVRGRTTGESKELDDKINVLHKDIRETEQDIERMEKAIRLFENEYFGTSCDRRTLQIPYQYEKECNDSCSCGI